MPTPSPTTYSAAFPPVAGGRVAPWLPSSTPRTNGNWTLQSAPQAVFRNGSTYFGWVASNGDIGVSRHNHDTGVTAHFVLAAAFEANGHDNATVTFLPDGRLICFYSKHNDTVGTRYRISTNPEDISAFDPAQTLAVTVAGNGVAYNNTFSLSNSGKTYVFYRAGDWTQKMRATVDGATFDTERTIVSNGSQRPYVCCYSDGVGRADFFFCTGNPAQVANSLYHACLLVDESGAESWFTSAGAAISGNPTPANATQVYAAAGGIDGWNWDIIRRANGDLWALWTKFVTPGSDHRVMFSRFDGAAWLTPVEITPNGGHIDNQTFSDGQACFDQRDPRIVYCGKKVGANCEMQAYFTANDGATWAHVAEITAASGEQNFSPVSPVGHDNRAAVLWLSGQQTDYTSFNTNISFAGRR